LGNECKKFTSKIQKDVSKFDFVFKILVLVNSDMTSLLSKYNYTVCPFQTVFVKRENYTMTERVSLLSIVQAILICCGHYSVIILSPNLTLFKHAFRNWDKNNAFITKHIT